MLAEQSASMPPCCLAKPGTSVQWLGHANAQLLGHHAPPVARPPLHIPVARPRQQSHGRVSASRSPPHPGRPVPLARSDRRPVDIRPDARPPPPAHSHRATRPRQQSRGRVSASRSPPHPGRPVPLARSDRRPVDIRPDARPPPTSHSVAPLAIQSSPLRCGFERPGQHIARNLVHTAQLGHLITWRPISVHELGPLRGRGRLERSLSTNRVDCIAAAYHWGRIHPKPKQSDGR